jgi:hypothetical protein
MIISSTNSVDSRSPKEWIRAAGPTGQTSGEGILARLKIAR